MGKIGEVKISTDSGDVSLPVFSSGDSGSNVSEALRVHTSSGTGFIPLVDESEAAYPYIRVQTDRGIMAFNDSESLSKIIDDFEDGDISEYTGETGGFAVVDGSNSIPDPVSGQYMLEAQVGQIDITSLSGLANYPEPGDTVEYWVWPGTSSSDIQDLVFKWAVQGTSRGSDGYQLTIDQAEGEDLRFDLRNGGASTLGTATDINFQTSEWHRITIDWGTDNSFEIRVYDADGNQKGSTITANDSTFTSGGISFNRWNDASSNQYFDNVRIK